MSFYQIVLFSDMSEVLRGNTLNTLKILKYSLLAQYNELQKAEWFHYIGQCY